MTSGVDFLQLADVDLGIDGRGFKALMPEQLLDVSDVRSAFKHVGGATNGNAAQLLQEYDGIVGISPFVNTL